MLSAILFLAVCILIGLLIGAIVIDRRIQTDLEAEVSFQRGRGDTLGAQVEADTKEIGRLHAELAKVRLDLRLLKAADITERDIRRLLASPLVDVDDEDLPEVTDDELEKLFGE